MLDPHEDANALVQWVLEGQECRHAGASGQGAARLRVPRRDRWKVAQDPVGTRETAA
jgi:hypothetical protein